MNKQLIYYSNGGAGNHGCEAITRSVASLIGNDVKHSIISNKIEEDRCYGLDSFGELLDLNQQNCKSVDYYIDYFKLKVLKQKYALDLYPYEQLVKKQLIDTAQKVAISVGGDNYCYGGVDYFYYLDQIFHKKNIKTAMVGCSIEPDVIANEIVQKDLKTHSLIIARESITYNALLENGITKVQLSPDPAFALGIKLDVLPQGFQEGNTIGLNFSPWVEHCGNGDNIIYKNAQNLIRHIIDTTDYQIALIPHVVWAHSNDYAFMNNLYQEFKTTGRIVLIQDCDAEALKGYISRCNMFMAARTHASIAAYSSCVPTVVVGYSVKALGIAHDLFGTSKHYVLPTQSIHKPTEFIDSFEWLSANEAVIREHLSRIMPNYVGGTQAIRTSILNLFD